MPYVLIYQCSHNREWLGGAEGEIVGVVVVVISGPQAAGPDLRQRHRPDPEATPVARAVRSIKLLPAISKPLERAQHG